MSAGNSALSDVSCTGVPTFPLETREYDVDGAGWVPAMKKALRRFAVPFISGVSHVGEVHVFEAEGERYVLPRRLTA